MQKQLTSILLVAGTSIGGGTIALPMVLAKLGIIPSLAIMLSTWLLTYYMSLVSVELNLHSDRGLSLGLLGEKFSGKIAQSIGELSVKLLSYALLSVYIYGSASILQKLMAEYFHCEISSLVLEAVTAFCAVMILSFPMKIVSTINNIAFSGFLLILLILIVSMSAAIDYERIPWTVDSSASNMLAVVTIVFTSFGYQIIFHTLRDYLGKNAGILRKAFLFGSLIPAIVYMIWTCSSLSVILKSAPDFFEQLTGGKVEVGEFVNVLANISGLPQFQMLIWCMSILAVVTSIFGVGLGLAESIGLGLKNSVSSAKLRNMLAAMITVIPAYAIAAVVPNAFIKILGFAGAILVIIAIILPAYLYFKSGIERPYLRELKKWAMILCSIIGIGIMAIEISSHV